MVIVGDIGGTHARLSLLSPNGRTVRHEVFASRDFPSIDAILARFLGQGKPHPKVKAVALGVAGPVVAGRCVATNLPWVIDSKVIARRLGARVTLINDLVALSLGALAVPRAKLRALGGAGAPKKRGANVAVIAAGTGLGEAMLVWDGTRFVPTATEGGHCDFAPGNDLEVELLAFLRDRFGHVSWERILSGNGLGNVYDFFVLKRGVRESDANARAIAAAPDRNAAIAALSEGRKSEAAARASELFASVYGAEAGNLALKALAVGGVFVCGNIAARMAESLEDNGFMKAFAAKGRFEALMKRIPVAVVLDSDVGLVGATGVALAR